ncbi:cyclin-domain-containing protein, partial [Chytridium lagenaria]
LIIESIWPNHSISSKAALLPLKKFIREILRRSRTSFSTLQLALLYIVRLRSQLTAKASVVTGARPHATLCGRRMLLSALIVAAKYLQDRNYSNKAWAKIAGLPLEEINLNEMEFLRIMDYDLYVSQKTYTSWSTML